MARSRAWSPEPVLSDLSRWLETSDPDFDEEALRLLAEFCDGRNVPLGIVSRRCWMRSRRLAAHAVVGGFRGEDQAAPQMRLAVGFDFCRLRILRESFDVDRRPRRASRLSLNDASIMLLAALSLGLDDVAREMGSVLKAGIHDGFLDSVALTRIGFVACRLYARWFDIDVDDAGLVKERAYELLLENLDEKEQVFRAAVIDACEVHVARSREHTSKETYEFAEEAYRLLPVEILAAYRWRARRGKALPREGHPLIETPLGKLWPEGPIPKDSILDRLLARVRPERS